MKNVKNQNPNAQKSKKSNTNTIFKPNPKTSVFVAGLPIQLNEKEALAEIRKKCPNLNFKTIYLIKNNQTGRSRGFGFITLESLTDRENFLKFSQKLKIGKRIIDIRLAKNYQRLKKEKKSGNGKRLFLSGIKSSLSDYDLKNHFSQFFNVERCYAIRDVNSEEARGLGFIDFVTEEDALECLRIKKFMIKNVKLKVKPYNPSEKNSKILNNKNEKNLKKKDKKKFKEKNNKKKFKEKNNYEEIQNFKRINNCTENDYSLPKYYYNNEIDKNPFENNYIKNETFQKTCFNNENIRNRNLDFYENQNSRIPEYNQYSYHQDKDLKTSPSDYNQYPYYHHKNFKNDYSSYKKFNKNLKPINFDIKNDFATKKSLPTEDKVINNINNTNEINNQIYLNLYRIQNNFENKSPYYSYNNNIFYPYISIYPYLDNINPDQFICEYFNHNSDKNSVRWEYLLISKYNRLNESGRNYMFNQVENINRVPLFRKKYLKSNKLELEKICRFENQKRE